MKEIPEVSPKELEAVNKLVSDKQKVDMAFLHADFMSLFDAFTLYFTDLYHSKSVPNPSK